MKNGYRRYFFRVAFFLIFLQLFGISLVYADNGALDVGIFPRRGIKITHTMQKPLMDYLSEKIGRPVNLHVSKDFATFWKAFIDGQYDLVHFNQYHYLLAHERLGYEAILRNVEFDTPYVSSVIITRKDSGINRLSDLRGKRIMFGGGPQAMMSYILPHWLLQQAGLSKGDYTEITAKNPPSALIATYKGAADAVGTGSVVLKMGLVQKIIDVDKMKIIKKTEAISFLPWAVPGDMEQELRDKIQHALSTLESTEKGRDILKKVRVSRFEKAVDADFDSARDFVRELYGESFEVK